MDAEPPSPHRDEDSSSTRDADKASPSSDDRRRLRISLASWRPPDRSAWSRLGRSSKRVREGEMELRWIQPAPDGFQRMAVRLRRKNGPAPLRNRIRRILRELHREHAAAIGEVWMLWNFPPVRVKMPTRDIRALGSRLLAQAGLLPVRSP